MKRLLLLMGFVTVARWRRSRFDRYDKEHGFGAYADVLPVVHDR